MLHALIQNNQITHVGTLPRIWWDGDRWHDLRDGDGSALGWLPITYEPRPDDTDTTTWDRNDPALVDGLPVIGWTERPKTSEEVAAEAEQNARLDDLAARVAAIEALVWPPAAPDAPADDAPTWAELVPPHHWPNGTLLRDGGTVWRNVSGGVLTTPPSGFPAPTSAWDRLFVEHGAQADPTVQTWSASASYEVGDRVTHDGQVWECKIAHGPEQQGQWQPGVAHNVWTVA